MDSGQSKTYEQELVNDMISPMSSFSSKIYGKHSAENRKCRKLEKLAALRQLPMGAAVPVDVEEIHEPTGILETGQQDQGEAEECGNVPEINQAELITY